VKGAGTIAVLFEDSIKTLRMLININRRNCLFSLPPRSGGQRLCRRSCSNVREGGDLRRKVRSLS